MPVPDRPVVKIGQGGELLVGIYRMRVTDRREHERIQRRVAVGMTIAKIEPAPFRIVEHGAAFRFAKHCVAKQPPRPLAAIFFEARGADLDSRLDAPSFQFTFQRGSGHVGQRLQRAGDENEFVSLTAVPAQTRDGFLENWERLQMPEHAVAPDSAEIALVRMLNGGKSMWKQTQSVRGPSHVICNGNLAPAAKHGVQATL